MIRIKHTLSWAAPLLLLVASPVYAHPLPGDAVGGFVGGLLHPLLGIDHLLAMVAVGVWAAQLGGSAVWKVPPAFVLTMLIGAGVGLAGIGLPLIEPMIAASVVMLGLVIGTRARMSALARESAGGRVRPVSRSCAYGGTAGGRLGAELYRRLRADHRLAARRRHCDGIPVA